MYKIRHRTLKVFPLFMLVICMFGVGVAEGSPINYNEVNDGDLPHPYSAAPSDFLTVDAGINTFTGSAIWATASENTDWDMAAITIPTGLQLDVANFSVEISEATGILSNIALAILAFDGSYNYIGNLGTQGVEPPFLGEVLSSGLPIGEGNYGFAFISYGGSLSSGEYAAFDYTWSFSVSSTTPVPEPTTVLLLGSGLIGLAGFRRKMKNRR